MLATVVIAGLGFRSYARGRRLEQQVEIARQVQAELLLLRGRRPWSPCVVAAVYRPAEQVSGDFYDVFTRGDGRIALVIGDVSGKGVPAALVTGVIHGALRSCPWSESSPRTSWSPRGSTSCFARGLRSRFATMFWCYYEPPHASSATSTRGTTRRS